MGGVSHPPSQATALSHAHIHPSFPARGRPACARMDRVHETGPRARGRPACARPPRMRWLMRSCCRGVSAEAPVPAAASAGTGLPAFCYPSSSTNSKSVEDEKIPDTSDENSGPQKPHAGERSGNSAMKPRPLTGRGCAKAGRVQVQPQGGTQARTVHKMLEMENRRRPAPGASGSGGGGRPALALLGSQPVGGGGRRGALPWNPRCGDRRAGSGRAGGF